MDIKKKVNNLLRKQIKATGCWKVRRPKSYNSSYSSDDRAVLRPNHRPD